MTSAQYELKDEDVEMEDQAVDSAGKKDRKGSANAKLQNVFHQFTLRKPSWTYFHLQVCFAESQEAIDLLTAKRYLTSALQRFLGLHGAAVPVDILKLQGQQVWIRVPRDDATHVHEALSSWVGGGEEASVRWVVKGKDDWIVRLAMGSGNDLFKP